MISDSLRWRPELTNATEPLYCVRCLRLMPVNKFTNGVIAAPSFLRWMYLVCRFLSSLSVLTYTATEAFGNAAASIMVTIKCLLLGSAYSEP